MVLNEENIDRVLKRAGLIYLGGIKKV